MRSVFAIFLFAACGLAGAESFLVTSVVGPDRVVVQCRGMPVSLTLAHLEVANDAAAQRACQERLSALLSGKSVEVVYMPAFGTAADGGARVQLVVDRANVNETLVASGLARFAAGRQSYPLFDVKIQRAEEKAKKDKVGMWAAAAAVAVVPITAVPPASASAPAAKAALVKTATAPSGPFCSELDNKYYYPKGDQAVANVVAQRLIYYPDEEIAKRAGKILNIPAAIAVVSGDVSVRGGDAIFSQGKEAYAQAIAKGNTSERDTLYEKAYVILSHAMNIYGTLCEKDPDDENLAEKLRECMQLRYGSIKQRRF
jgi:hypothetical protein